MTAHISSETSVQVATWLPKRPGCNATAPEPLNKAVKIISLPGAKIYARTFPGYAFSWTFKAQAFKLAKALIKSEVRSCEISAQS